MGFTKILLLVYLALFMVDIVALRKEKMDFVCSNNSDNGVRNYFIGILMVYIADVK